jgi:hypothetical protein
MIQCEQCEFFSRGPDGHAVLSCDPFSTIKEPECLAKWQLAKMSLLVAAYQSTLSYYRKLAPMQEKMFKVMEKEIDDISEADRWKVDDDQGEDPDADDGLWDEQDKEY